jgi:Fur family transcriptional regulator, ferric uptake regulator
MDNSDLKKAGLKVTLPRLRILQILESAPARHLSADQVYQILAESGDETAFATVYRVLDQFEAAGLVIRHNFAGGHSVFELDNGDHHDHLICIHCGRVEEFFDELIEARQKQVASAAGYAMTDHSLNIYGFCQNCNKAEKIALD